MNGRDFVATVQITTKMGEVVAEPGETCERVREASLPWLLEQGYIVDGPQGRDIVPAPAPAPPMDAPAAPADDQSEGEVGQ